MNNTEFKKFILETATKYFEADSKEEKAVVIKEQAAGCDISADQVKVLAEEMRKINKKIDLRNPLINPEFFDKVNEAAEVEEVKVIKENKRYLKEDKPLLKEAQKSRWKNLYNYDVPTDEKR